MIEGRAGRRGDLESRVSRGSKGMENGAKLLMSARSTGRNAKEALYSGTAIDDGLYSILFFIHAIVHIYIFTHYTHLLHPTTVFLPILLLAC